MDDNPYKPPRAVGHAKIGHVQPMGGAASFWLGTAFAAVGFASLFLRNSPPGGWLLIGLALFVAATFRASPLYRVASMVGVLFCFLIFGGALYQRRWVNWEHQRIQEKREMQSRR
jgi:hypothetical protein